VGSIPIARSNFLNETERGARALSFAGLEQARESVMAEPGGWLWAIIGVFGVGGLAVALAYGSAIWRRRGKDTASRQKQNEVIRDNYRKGG
jgi:hypothetical protein